MSSDPYIMLLSAMGAAMLTIGIGLIVTTVLRRR